VTHLRQLMLDELERRNYSPNRVQSYLHAVEEFARHFGRSPEQLGPDHVCEYQVHLFRDRKLSARTIAGQTAALRFRPVISRICPRMRCTRFCAGMVPR
jgi:integrase/recombinase XerD